MGVLGEQEVFFMSHMRARNFLYKTLAGIFFNVATFSFLRNTDAGYYFRSPVAAGFFLQELGLQGTFFQKSPPLLPSKMKCWPLSAHA